MALGDSVGEQAAQTLVAAIPEVNKAVQDAIEAEMQDFKALLQEVEAMGNRLLDRLDGATITLTVKLAPKATV
jgi:hypothetical protein